MQERGRGCGLRVGEFKPCLTPWKPPRGWTDGEERAPCVLLDSPGGACTRSGRTLARTTRRGAPIGGLGRAAGDGMPACGSGVPPARHWPRPAPDGGGRDGCTRAGSPRHGRPTPQERSRWRSDHAAGRCGAHDRLVCVTNDAPCPSRCAMRCHTDCLVTCGSCIAHPPRRALVQGVAVTNRHPGNGQGRCMYRSCRYTFKCAQNI